MLCETCGKKVATVHITKTQAGASPVVESHHFCEDCADAYHKGFGNSFRSLIQLTDWYRSKLYDLLEAERPEAFKSGNEVEGGEYMGQFLSNQLNREGIEVSDDVFSMLFGDFVGSAEVYERQKRLWGAPGQD